MAAAGGASALQPNALQQSLPEYEVGDELGRGAMGIVYLGRHRALDRKVAIKQLPASFAADAEVRERFLAEARTVAGLNHPHVVVIHDFVERDGVLAIVMEHLPNGTVWDQFVHHGLSAPKACGLTLATLAGCHHAHNNGVLHRDIKPENLIFNREWELKVTDFGIAQMLTGEETMGTESGSIVGTPAYMSPEQAEGLTCGPAADVYAAGAMLYEMLSGELPFPDENDAMSMARARLTKAPVPLESVAPDLPKPIVDVVMKSLMRDTQNRYASAEDFGVALGEAAASSWGPDWLTASDSVVLGSRAIEAASRTTGQMPMPAASAETTTDTATDTEGEPATDAPAPAPAPSAESVQALAAAAAVAVQPKAVDRIEGADLNQLRPDEIVRVANYKKPPSPLLPLLLGLALLAAAAYAIAVGFGDDPSTIAATEGDFTTTFDVGGLPSGQVDASFLGVPLGSGTINGSRFDPGYLQWTAAGTVELASPDGSQVALARPTNSVYLTAPFVAAAMLALGGLASAQSNLRGLRGRRLRIGPYIGLAISGALAGAAGAVLGMLLLDTPVSRTSVIVAAAAGALGLMAIGEVYRRVRRRRRVKQLAAARVMRS